MAYLDFEMTPFSSPTIEARPRIGSVASFTPLEWLVVDIAGGDDLSSLKEPGPAATLRRWIFGERPANSFADARLEALRRISVFGWRRSCDVPSEEVKGFFQAGFTLEQYELLMVRIRAPRTALSNRCGRHSA